MARMKPAKPRLRPARNAAPPTPARAKRITGNSLIAIRRKHFAKQPLCVACKADGRIRLATELDHITPLWAGGRLRLLFTNLRPMWATDNISNGAKVLALL